MQGVEILAAVEETEIFRLLVKGRFESPATSQVHPRWTAIAPPDSWPGSDQQAYPGSGANPVGLPLLAVELPQRRAWETPIVP